jgi:hypothetical protein
MQIYSIHVIVRNQEAREPQRMILKLKAQPIVVFRSLD